MPLRSAFPTYRKERDEWTNLGLRGAKENGQRQQKKQILCEDDNKRGKSKSKGKSDRPAYPSSASFRPKPGNHYPALCYFGSLTRRY